MGWLKGIAKAALNLVGLLLAAPFLVHWVIVGGLLKSRRTAVFQGVSQALSLLPGFTGILCRRAFYRRALNATSGRIEISFGTLLSDPGAEFGDDVYVGANCMIGRVTVGKDTLIGSNVDILSGKNQHDFTDPTVPMRLQGGTFTRVTIGEDVWIGNGAVVMADIGSHAIVAAGSVVVKDVGPWEVVGGNPAKVLRVREGAPSAS